MIHYKNQLTNNIDFENAFYVLSKVDNTMLKCVCTSPAQMNEWLTAINDQLRKSNTIEEPKDKGEEKTSPKKSESKKQSPSKGKRRRSLKEVFALKFTTQ